MILPEPRLISPMLDGFVVGAPISDHHGVRCCPAMTKDTNQRYLLKIIRVPASQINIYKRDVQGVIVMRVEEGNQLVALERIEKTEEPEA
jgi:hypothetical protein